MKTPAAREMEAAPAAETFDLKAFLAAIPEQFGPFYELRPLDEDEAAELSAIMSRRYRSGHHDTAERHNEHQP